jgi:hypothetical protein
VTQEKVVGLRTYDIVNGDASDSENLKIAVGLKDIFCFDFGCSDAQQVDYKHHQSGMGNPEFTEIVMGESFEKGGRNDGVEGEDPDKEIHHIPHPGFGFVAIGQGGKGEPIAWV